MDNERIAHWTDCADRCDNVPRGRNTKLDNTLCDASNMLREAARALSADRGEAVEKGPWSAIHERGIYERGQWVLQSEDFTHDVRLYINGDFASDAQEQAYAELIAARLNATPPSPAESADVPFDVVRQVVRALTRLGVSTPCSQEEQYARGVELIRDLCAEVGRHFDGLTAEAAAPSQMADADARARFEAWARPRWSHYPEAFDIIPGRPEPEYNHDGVQARFGLNIIALSAGRRWKIFRPGLRRWSHALMNVDDCGGRATS